MPSTSKNNGEGDLFQLKIASAYAGTVFLNVWNVSLKWKDFSNRDLNHDHLQKLVSMFEASIHCVDESKCLKASVTKAEWEEFLQYLSELMNAGTIPAPLDYLVEVSSLAIIAKDKTCIISHLDHSTLIFPYDIPVTPILEAGQHWAAALESMMVQRTWFLKTPDGQLQSIPPAQDEVWVISEHFQDCANIILGFLLGCRCVYSGALGHRLFICS